jgi:hydrogenase nickel incorporation protein HypB
VSVVKVERKILEKNDAIASHNRKLFSEKNIFVMNMLSSPGSGKTSIIEKSVVALGSKIKCGVIEGDVQTDLDAQRLDALNIPVVQIITNGGCHLEANLVGEAFSKFENQSFNLLIIENVGNLVCPAGFDLGEHLKVVLISVTEGDDKPLKYPVAFRNSSVLIVNKIDLLPYVNSSVERLKKNALQVNPLLKIFEISCVTYDGIDDWCEWLKSQINKNESSSFY